MVVGFAYLLFVSWLLEYKQQKGKNSVYFTPMPRMVPDMLEHELMDEWINGLPLRIVLRISFSLYS